MARALSGIDETGLMSRHLAGDNAAFAELFQRLHQRLFTYCLKIVGDPEHAEDAMSELWERIILLRRHPSHISNPVGFLLKSARNICLNQIKSRRRTTHFSMLAESGHPQEERRELSEVEEEVLAAVQSLPVEYREVIVLNVYLGYSLSEIAEMLEKSPEAIWKRMSRAREKLRRAVMSKSAFAEWNTARDGEKNTMNGRTP